MERLLPDSSKQKTGLSISDLHLGQAGSVGHRHLQQLTRLVEKDKPDQIFLNGDIIEVLDLTGTRSQILAKVDQSLEKLDAFIETAIKANPNVKISYIFGNHDNYRELEAKIKERIECSKPNLESHESHIKSKNTIHLHGDLQADMAFRGTSDKIKAIFRGNVSIHMGAMTREDVGRSKDEPLYKLGIEDSLWRSVTDKPGKVRNFAKKQFSRIKNALDEPISSRVTPLDQVMKAIHDTIKTQQPELLDGVKNIVLGHYHPPGKPILEYEGIKFIFTGPSTLFSKGPAYSFSIDEEGKFDDFQAIELSRHLGARGGGGSLAR